MSIGLSYSSSFLSTNSKLDLQSCSLKGPSLSRRLYFPMEEIRQTDEWHCPRFQGHRVGEMAFGLLRLMSKPTATCSTSSLAPRLNPGTKIAEQPWVCSGPNVQVRVELEPNFPLVFWYWSFYREHPNDCLFFPTFHLCSFHWLYGCFPDLGILSQSWQALVWLWISLE